MSYRLHGAPGRLCAKLRTLMAPGHARVCRAPRLRGKLRRAVVVPAPDAMFSEAVFILRDETLREAGLSREALLREAAEAAERYTAENLSACERLPLHPAAAFLLGSAVTLLLLWALRVL